MAILDPQVLFGAPWRSIVTDLDGSVQTVLDKVALSRSVEYGLNTQASARGQANSGDPRVNILAADGSRYVSFSDRQLILCRRELATPPYYVPRFAGVMMTMQDEAVDANALTSYVAFDPWMVLRSRPVVTDAGNLPGPNGWTVKNKRGDEVVTALLENQAVFCSDGFHPEAFLDWGQTPYYAGTMEATPLIEAINFQQGATVGDAFDQLTQAGYLDIVLGPIFDQRNRPGILCEVNCFTVAGQPRYDAVMSWGLPPNSLLGASPAYDGTALANKILYYPGQGGPGIPVQSDPASMARYGDYWRQVFFSGQYIAGAVEALALVDLLLRSRGKKTLSVSPATAKAPVALLEYGLGDTLPVWASDQIRQPFGPTANSIGTSWLDPNRVYGISIQLPDSEPELVDRLVLSRDDDVAVSG